MNFQNNRITKKYLEIKKEKRPREFQESMIL